MEGHRKGSKKKKAEVYTEAEERMENIEVGKIKKKVEKKKEQALFLPGCN